ncbi:hypothetical protein POVWA2_092130 [Plasmodium ovale wallikeri]|uniref:STP1 protein n=1 Tax=Plasmodium ovale wallikeri TaxID=864142 RepID=A0A1A9ASD1_PLAOA|nr:hypothetical protein POVWA2_092130 [Plasmodium ovale wallikeri]
MQNYMCSNVSYSVIKMADNTEYTALTRYITPEFFISMIASDIKELIHTYGHKNCGLIQEELCDKIKKIIPEKKKIIFKHMDEPSMQKWNSEWSSKRNDFFNKLYEEEGFINKCFPKKYPKKNQSLNQLLSKHIEFCKENDQRLSVIGKSREYSVCLEYNVWIINKTASFSSEYLRNVRDYKIQTVKKFFSTKKHPQGYDPLTTYRNIRFDCEIYNPASNRYQPVPVENTPQNSIHPPTAHDVGQEFQGKGGKSMPDKVGDIQKNKPDVQILHKTEPSSSDSQTPSLANTKLEDNANGQLDDLKAKGTGLTNNAQDSTGKPTRATNAKAPSFQQVPEPPSLTSPKDSLAATVPNLPSVIKDQDTDPDVTPSTTLATSSTTHSTENVRSPLAPDLSLVKSQPQPQLPPVDHA